MWLKASYIFANRSSILIFFRFVVDEYQSNPVHRQECGCRSACHEVTYDAKLSMFRYPSPGYTRYMGIGK